MRLHSSTFFITLTRLATSLLALSITPLLAQSDPAVTSLSPEIMKALGQEHIYISPVMRKDTDERAIITTLQSARTPTRVLLLEQLPPGVPSPWQWAASMHEYFSMSDGLIVVVTERPRNIIAYGAGLDKPTLQNIVATTTKTVDAEGYAAGIAQIVRLVDEERAGRRAARIQVVFWVIGVGLVLAILLFRCRRRDNV